MEEIDQILLGKMTSDKLIDESCLQEIIPRENSNEFPLIITLFRFSDVNAVLIFTKNETNLFN